MADAISTLGSWTYGAKGTDVYGTISLNSDGTLTVNNYEGSFELNALYATNNDDDGASRYKGSLNMNGVVNAQGEGVKWDAQVVIDSAGLRGADELTGVTDITGFPKEEQQEYATSYLEGESSYILSAELTRSLFNFVESKEDLADVQLGIRATSGGELQEDSYKLQKRVCIR